MHTLTILNFVEQYTVPAVWLITHDGYKPRLLNLLCPVIQFLIIVHIHFEVKKLSNLFLHKNDFGLVGPYSHTINNSTVKKLIICFFKRPLLQLIIC